MYRLLCIGLLIDAVEKICVSVKIDVALLFLVNVKHNVAPEGSVTLCGILLFPGVLQFAGKQTRRAAAGCR